MNKPTEQAGARGRGVFHHAQRHVMINLLRTTGTCGLRHILTNRILVFRAPNQAPVVLSKLQPGWAFGI